MSERETLRRAKEVLLQRGWHQGSFTARGDRAEGPVCLSGAVALGAGCGIYDLWSAAAPETRHLLVSLIETSIPGWNDKPDRTFEEVIALLDKALASLPPDVEQAAVSEGESSLGGLPPAVRPKVTA